MAEQENRTENVDALENASGAAVDNSSDNTKEESLDYKRFLEYNSAVNKQISEANVETAADLNKHLKDVTADTQMAQTMLDSISNLPFDKLIGGPLNAAIAAQSEAAKSTLKFVQTAGLKDDKVIVVSFEYIRNGTLKKFQIPLITLVPIPTFAIKALDYEFKIKLTADSRADVSIGNSLDTMWNAGYNTSVPTEKRPESKPESKPEVGATPGAENKPDGTDKSGDAEAASEGGDKKASKADGAEQKQKAEGGTLTVPEMGQAKQKADEAKKQASIAAQSSKLAEKAATSQSKGLSLSATISTKKDSKATRESKYSVEATMDVRIHAAQDDLPSGLLTMLEVLNNAHNTYDPDGELSVKPSESLPLDSNGKAVFMVSYLNEEGFYAPSSVSCEGAAIDIVNKTTARITFRQEGVFTITAGKQTAVVTVENVPSTKPLI